MNLFIAVQRDFIQGDLVSEDILGVYDEREKAENRNSEVEMDTPYDPVLRSTFDVKQIKLNEAIEPE